MAQKPADIFDIDPGSADASGPWLFWSLEPEQWFLDSVRDHGQLQPALVAEEGGRLLLVSGYKRLLACDRLRRRLAVRTVSGGEVAKGLIHLHDNCARRPGDSLLLRCARYFQERMPAGEINDFLGRELAPFCSRRTLRALADWLELQGHWDAHLAAGRIHLEAGSLLADMDPEGRGALEPFFADLSWSRSNARNFLTWISESAKREGCSAARIVQRHGLEGILRQDLSPRDRLDRLARVAREIRYPELTRLESGFQSLGRELCRGTAWSIRPAPGFEKNDLHLETNLREEADLSRAARDLESIRESGLLEKLRRWQRDNLL
jgi:ParB family chromosome partitioning protein